MTSAQLDAIQNRLDRGVTSSVDTYDLLQEVRRLQQGPCEACPLHARVQELEEQVQRQDDELTDLALQSRYTSSALDGWEGKVDHMHSSYETALLLRDEEIAQLKARLA